MRTIFIIFFLGVITSLGAQTYIRVSNNAGAVADYSNLQTAINSAPVGATIFVDPSATNYGDITINKRLTLLGGGWDATKHYNKSSTVGSVYLNKQTNNPSRTILSGLNVTGNLSATNSASYGIDSITIMRCQINGSYAYISINGSSADTVVGWKIINSKIWGITFNSYIKNILLCNDIITLSITGLNQYSVFVTNNIFLNSPPGNSNSFTNYSNNIFISAIPLACSNCTFYNNMTLQGLSSLSYGDNVAANNKEGIALAQIFVNFSSGDYHLASTSPGKNAGSDGTDIGIYGGLYPWPDKDYGITGYPEVMSLGIANPVVEPNGTLKVNVKSRIIH